MVTLAFSLGCCGSVGWGAETRPIEDSCQVSTVMGAMASGPPDVGVSLGPELMQMVDGSPAACSRGTRPAKFYCVKETGEPPRRYHADPDSERRCCVPVTAGTRT